MTKTSKQNIKYLENKKSFQGEIKKKIIIFKRLSVAKNCLRPESAPLMIWSINILLQHQRIYGILS